MADVGIDGPQLDIRAIVARCDSLGLPCLDLGQAPGTRVRSQNNGPGERVRLHSAIDGGCRKSDEIADGGQPKEWVSVCSGHCGISKVTTVVVTMREHPRKAMQRT